MLITVPERVMVHSMPGWCSWWTALLVDRWYWLTSTGIVASRSNKLKIAADPRLFLTTYWLENRLILYGLLPYKIKLTISTTLYRHSLFPSPFLPLSYMFPISFSQQTNRMNCTDTPTLESFRRWNELRNCSFRADFYFLVYNII